jgi:DNA-directed RNA polymerase subunit M/transcription elongation factor TFIIS
MSTGWLSPEDCPDCGGPLLDTSTSDEILLLECPGCGYRIRWHTADPDPTDPGETEAE